MAKALQVKLVRAGSSDLTFDTEATPEPRYQFIYKTASTDPRPIEAVRIVYTLRQCRFTASSDVNLWIAGASLPTFIAALKTRGTGAVTSAQFIRDPAGTPQTLDTLSEGFQIEDVSFYPDRLHPTDQFLTTAMFDITFSAFVRLEDADSIVTWNQVVELTEDNGLEVLEWRTEVTTKEGTDARTVLRAVGAIPAASVGPNHVWETNDSYGVHVTWTDADENNSRTPTAARGVSRIRRTGSRVGATSPGNAPSKVSVRVTTETTGAITATTTEVSAFGSNAKSFVLQRRPSSFITEVLVEHESLNGWSALWTDKVSVSGGPGAGPNNWYIALELSGGDRKVTWGDIFNGLPPKKFVGAKQPWVLTMQVSSQFIGRLPANADLSFPAVLPDPWELNRNKTVETYANRINVGIDRTQDLWERRAVVVYESPVDPVTPDIVNYIFTAPSVVSYKLLS